MTPATAPHARLAPWIRWAWLLPLFLLLAALALPRGPVAWSLPWVPALDLQLSFVADGLSRLFLLLVAGVGVAVFYYAPGYLRGHARLGQLMGLLTAFMLAMAGAILADSLLLLLLFWEATSVLSFLLVGFEHEGQDSRDSARQALLVTGAGGLALLAGFVLILLAAPALRLSDLARLDPALLDDPRFHAGVALALAGAMTKSAQFPFHFWLPGAMAAPTPVSAYLHSATMVNLGVYVLARFDEAMGGVAWWSQTLLLIGTITALWGALQAPRERDLKRILAWSTVSALGTLTVLIGLPNELGALAFAAFLIAHALYKAPLFFVAGNVDHATGTRLIGRLRGLRRAMPASALAALLAGVSMAGLPATAGFIAKDTIKAAKEVSEVIWLVEGVSLLVSTIGVAVASVAALRIFFGAPDALAESAHEGGRRLTLPPLALALAGILLGLFPALAETLVIDAARMIAPALDPAAASLQAEWLLRVESFLLTWAIGVAVYFGWDRLHRGFERLSFFDRIGPAAAYGAALTGLKRMAGALARRLQDGRLSRYLGATAAAAVLLAAPAALALRFAWPATTPAAGAAGVVAGCAAILAGAVLAVRARDTLGRLLGAGAVGFGSALVFLFRGAPDLALTQLAVETVFVVVAAVVLRRYRPREAMVAARASRAAIALAFGLLLAAALLALGERPLDGGMARYFLDNSVPQAHGRNVVNVIIVDFRSLDTLGEIAVVMLAALAAWPLARRLRSLRRRP